MQYAGTSLITYLYKEVAATVQNIALPILTE
jgi:hypothetical protein